MEISLWLLLIVQMSLWEFPLTGEGRDRDSEVLSGRFFSLILPLIEMKFQPQNPNPVLTHFSLIVFIFMYSSCNWFIKLQMDHKTRLKLSNLMFLDRLEGVSCNKYAHDGS